MPHNTRIRKIVFKPLSRKTREQIRQEVAATNEKLAKKQQEKKLLNEL